MECAMAIGAGSLLAGGATTRLLHVISGTDISGAARNVCFVLGGCLILRSFPVHAGNLLSIHLASQVPFKIRHGSFGWTRMIHLVMMIASIHFWSKMCGAGFLCSRWQSGAVRTAIRRLNSSPGRRPFVRGKQSRYESIVITPLALPA